MKDWMKYYILPHRIGTPIGLSLTRRGYLVWKALPIPWWWWIPCQGLVMAVWNHVYCRLYGHDYVLVKLARAGHIPASQAKCPNCCTRLP